MRHFPQRLSRFGGWLGTAALAGLVLVSQVAGQKPAAAATASPRAARAAAARPAAGGLRTGIRVHGRWTIVVRNPNGSIAAKREFENTLQLDGVNALPIVLGGYAAPGGWEIMMGGATGTPGPCGNGGSVPIVGQTASIQVSGPCLIVEPGSLYGDTGGASPGCGGAGSCSATLQQSLVATGSVTETVLLGGITAQITDATVGLQLSGFTPVSAAGSVDTVASLLSLCNVTEPSANTSAPGYPAASLTTIANVSSAACRTGPVSFLTGSYADPWFVTATTIPSGPINVIAGQTVQVTVVISFS